MINQGEIFIKSDEKIFKFQKSKTTKSQLAHYNVFKIGAQILQKIEKSKIRKSVFRNKMLNREFYHLICLGHTQKKTKVVWVS